MPGNPGYNERPIRGGEKTRMRNISVAALALAGIVFSNGPAAAYFFDDSNYWGPLKYPVPYAYGYSYARGRCGHYYARPWIVSPCGGRVSRHGHRHKKRLDN
jgi:hypothetical protein